MVKMVKHKGKNYVVITTTFHTGDIEVPAQIQINITDIDPKDHYTIYREAAFLLNRPLKLAKPQPKQDKTSWWGRLFGTK